MVDGGDAYEVFWTPEFKEDVLLAVDYIQNYLKSPSAAKGLLADVEDVLETVSVMPRAAVRRITPAGTEFYVVAYKHWNIFYTVNGHTIKVVALKHQLQSS
ncbi:MAG: type II toxin-antitoxin system RelE/ParE family toxin [Atopobiaceae bacterium]|jgi:plasmid stabilization system protein ParE